MGKVHAKKLALFDFDGTITLRDTLFDFIVYAHGYTRSCVGLLVLSPILFAYTIRVIPNWQAKQMVLQHFFKGWRQRDFEAVATSYSKERIPKILRKKTCDQIKWHQNQGHKVVVVTASIDSWISGWCKENDLELISTQMEVDHGTITGRLLTKNCYGAEKVIRIKKAYNLDDFDEIYTYGNSRGDLEMMQLSKRSPH